MLLSALLFAAISLVQSAPIPAGSHFVFRQSVSYDTSITVPPNSAVLQTVSFYTRHVNLPRAMDVVLIDWTIPFTGVEQAGKHGRVQLFVNGQAVSDASFFNRINWQLHQLHLKAVLPDVPPGTLIVEIRAGSPDGVMHIPHYNPSLIERLLSPSLSASFSVVGIPK